MLPPSSSPLLLLLLPLLSSSSPAAAACCCPRAVVLVRGAWGSPPTRRFPPARTRSSSNRRPPGGEGGRTIGSWRGGGAGHVVLLEVELPSRLNVLIGCCDAVRARRSGARGLPAVDEELAAEVGAVVGDVGQDDDGLVSGAVEAEVGGVAAGLPGVMGDGLTGHPGGGPPEAADAACSTGRWRWWAPGRPCRGRSRRAVRWRASRGPWWWRPRRRRGRRHPSPRAGPGGRIRTATGDECGPDLDGRVGHAERFEQPGAHQVGVAQVGCRGDGLAGDGRPEGGVGVAAAALSVWFLVSSVIWALSAVKKFLPSGAIQAARRTVAAPNSAYPAVWVTSSCNVAVPAGEPSSCGR